ncbi:MAG: NADH-quinone oxidoreductase subunit NuoE [Gammaproteobacteria bacterium]|nr:NADH-quinone oxidoreductase subunit NuoE [Gammaproteobacteria bacterium]
MKTAAREASGLTLPAMISAEALAKIEHWLAKYPPEQKISAVIPALTIVQDENGGWLSNNLMDAVATYLGIPSIAVYEVATFYTMFELKPLGRHKISVCTNISCMLRGSDGIVRHLEKKLGVRPGETTADGKFTVKEVECLAACGGAPMFVIGKRYYENLTPDKVDQILASLE